MAENWLSGVAPNYQGGMGDGSGNNVYSAVNTGVTYGWQDLYWYKIDTSKLDGQVVQMTTGSFLNSSSSSRDSGSFTCYLTDKGSVYCGGDNNGFTKLAVRRSP